MSSEPLADTAPDIPQMGGGYVLFVELGATLVLDGPRFGGSTLAPGLYAYCGSARGPGGLHARIGRHLRPDKARRWHIDSLTAIGRIAGVAFAADADECALRRALSGLGGVSAPVPGFGSSDCRDCPAHLLRLPTTISPRSGIIDWPGLRYLAVTPNEV